MATEQEVIVPVTINGNGDPAYLLANIRVARLSNGNLETAIGRARSILEPGRENL